MRTGKTEQIYFSTMFILGFFAFKFNVHTIRGKQHCNLHFFLPFPVYRYTESLNSTAPTAIRLWETFTFAYFPCYVNS